VTPKNKMKTLFWSRILLDKAILSNEQRKSVPSSASLTFTPIAPTTIWGYITDADIDTTDFEEKFSKSAPVTSTASRGDGIIRVLDARRSQAIAIMKSSLPNENILK